MKKITQLLLIFLLAAVAQPVFCQISGNANYQQNQNATSYNYDANYAQKPNNANIHLQVRGLANLKADAYIAIFAVTQTAKTTEEAVELIDKRLNEAVANLKSLDAVEIYIDMISFVPMYELEVEKKLFSKKNYTEIPSGFEIKKNIHLKFTNPNLLNQFISILADKNIYDLVKVDYYSSQLDAVKTTLKSKAVLTVQDKIKHCEALTGESLANIERQINDAFSVTLPFNLYQTYEAYSSNALQVKKPNYVYTAAKNTTIYYQAIPEHDFDFVINPASLEPSIQIIYELDMVLNREKQKSNNYILLTPNGDLKTLNLPNK